MRFIETRLRGANIDEQHTTEHETRLIDRSCSRGEFEERGMNPNLVQCNLSFNARRGTLRGMHYQAAPHAQAKLVRCTAGAIFDCIIDLREGSETYAQWVGVELSAESRTQLYVPEGFAHGFQTLADGTEVFYQMSSPYVPGSARGVRWDDPAFRIVWPEADERVINERDRTYPDFRP
jgi:dTDP-4-dehydrorhamnose 3,5-epimerase